MKLPSLILAVSAIVTVTTAANHNLVSAALAESNQLKLGSDVPEIVLSPLQHLPQAPSSGDVKACEFKKISPKSTAGLAIVASGWGVTAEASLGDYTVISFAGNFEDDVQGTCKISDGNVGIFLKEELVAIAYAQASSKHNIGLVVPRGEASLQIWDGDILSQPFAEIVLDGSKDIKVIAISSENAVCGNRTAVPNIYNQPISKARAMLIAKGWEPAPRSANRTAPREKRYATNFPEVKSCLQTGLADCEFEYRSTVGKLSVTTVGDNDDPKVSNYSVQCGA